MGTEVIKNEKILYYLGAGASAKALPLARTVWEENLERRLLQPEIEDRIRKIKIKGLAYELEHFLDNGYPANNSNFRILQEVKKIKQQCKDLSKKANEFGDVDTYAKFLQIIDPKGDELNNLKKLVSIYFSIKQTSAQAIDPRYVPWLVGIMKEKQFPDNVKILSWNYDSQIQIATRTFGYSEDLSSDANNTNYSPPLICSFPDLNFIGREARAFSLLHLNGRAGLTNTKSAIKASIYQSQHCKSSDTIIEFLTGNDVHSSLHFAWENSSYHTDLMKDVSKMIEDVTIMVVIGYSFPFFNREVDKAVFKQLKANGKFYKIYYQDPVLNGQQLKAQFELDKDFPIVHISQIDNFHIPFEY